MITIQQPRTLRSFVNDLSVMIDYIHEYEGVVLRYRAKYSDDNTPIECISKYSLWILAIIDPDALYDYYLFIKVILEVDIMSSISDESIDVFLNTLDRD